MVPLIIGMLLCVGLALAVVAVVAVPARREGRDLLSPQGEEIVAAVKEKTADTLESTIEKTGDVISATKDKVSDTVQRDPSEDSGRHRRAS
ncbi:hypothetical protein [Phycicoccus sp. Root563]|uniref:hypothetical protein n=1 Tax=Phycicoccus sp. Root563 TaxID=1736562 RepID=UPI000702D2D6|nr:hypothetical protein [Phycicoccus sp. Root563]KQZ88906.1 hypothetical protein ASD62_05915 [Phycicoccus sp. Root563]